MLNFLFSKLGGAILLLTVLWFANGATAQEPTAETVTEDTLSGRYRVMIGDTVAVDFFKTTDLSSSLTVGPDGDVFLPLIGRVRVAGRTLDEVTEELTRRYRSQLADPQITVSVVEYAGLSVYVGGEVNEPGIVDYRGGLTAVQAIMNAGGFKTTASLSNVLLIRKGPNNEPVGTVVNVKDILHKAKFDNDQPLQPTDVIFVPRSKIANVNLFIDQYIDNNIPSIFGYLIYRR